jgi:hypothetical protein
VASFQFESTVLIRLYVLFGGNMYLRSFTYMFQEELASLIMKQDSEVLKSLADRDVIEENFLRSSYE